MDYPCGACGKEVKDDDRAIQCEIDCMLWFHKRCLNLTEEQYDKLSKSDCFWQCSACKKDLPELNSKDAVDVFHFDFQQNLPTPKLPVGKQFYLRLLWTYLFGVYSASTRITTAFMWHELLARRGCNDVISCLFRFIFHIPLGRTGAKWSIWWADNCPSQNKNNYVVWFFQEMIRRKVYSRIDYKFLIPGHTYGSTDQAFGMIERYTSKIETVYVPQQWYEHVTNASTGISSVKVIEMKQSFFHDFRQYLNNMYTERNKDEQKRNLDFQSVVWFNFGKGEKEIEGKLVLIDHPREVWVRYTYNVREKPCHVCYFKKRNQLALDAYPPLLYSQYPIPIKRKKAEDLHKLVGEYVPLDYQSFYAVMPEIENDLSSDEDTD